MLSVSVSRYENSGGHTTDDIPGGGYLTFFIPPKRSCPPDDREDTLDSTAQTLARRRSPRTTSAPVPPHPNRCPRPGRGSRKDHRPGGACSGWSERPPELSSPDRTEGRRTLSSSPERVFPSPFSEEEDRRAPSTSASPSKEPPAPGRLEASPATSLAGTPPTEPRSGGPVCWPPPSAGRQAGGVIDPQGKPPGLLEDSSPEDWTPITLPSPSGGMGRGCSSPAVHTSFVRPDGA
ncbi:hypothetical protein GMRT_24500 [Giardia muris]|uniref:Uncharacterized protein n=1 Tax=Giardia muris TaxID=5742 RepID=A0A4Z1SKU1_GIAMU|nr:hypothetical protein GMRT_24500 [Giardia muris]|eukprot:TNJ26242.1 hypothetical protein GMRT_24500 [Giardia muris]